MKILLIVLACSLFAVIFAWTDGSAPVARPNISLIEEVERLPSEVIGLGYEKLNPAEKSLFWHRHIDRFLNDLSLPSNLKAHILKLKSFVNEDLYRTLNGQHTRQRIASFTKTWFDEPVGDGTFSKELLLNVATFKGVGKETTNLAELSKTAYAIRQEQRCICYYSLSCPGVQTCHTIEWCQNNGPTTCGLTGTSKCTGDCY